MGISFDPAKSERNERDRGLPFSLVAQLDWSDAVVFTPRAGMVHVISLRKANKREVKLHEQKAKP